MGYSAVAYTSMALADITAPGVPEINLVRVANREVEARVTLPTIDADGQPISGMNELFIGLLEEATPGVNPFELVAPEDITSEAESNGGQSATIFVSDADAGLLKAVRFAGLTIGKIYWAATTVRDDS